MQSSVEKNTFRASRPIPLVPMDMVDLYILGDLKTVSQVEMPPLFHDSENIVAVCDQMYIYFIVFCDTLGTFEEALVYTQKGAQILSRKKIRLLKLKGKEFKIVGCVKAKIIKEDEKL